MVYSKCQLSRRNHTVQQTVISGVRGLELGLKDGEDLARSVEATPGTVTVSKKGW